MYAFHTTDWIMKRYGVTRGDLLRSALDAKVIPEQRKRGKRIINIYRRDDIPKIVEWRP